MTDALHWWPAVRVAEAIRSKEVSSREVLDHFVSRIEKLDGPINAVVQWDLDRARTEAVAADDATMSGAHDGVELGALHGVPMTIKDSFQTEGCITTSGAPELAHFVPDVDAAPVARLREAGAILFAKTNLPIYAGDFQSYNAVYGCTNNPHDLRRTPGGSSGGSAAALAMGFTPLELGSDIGGSIRIPAHYSGVMGHKPSYGVVPSQGQIPGPPGTLSQADLAVSGPMARHANDLEVGLDVMAGPDRWASAAWRLELPQTRATTLRDFRIAAWLDDPACPVDDDTTAGLSALVSRIEDAGGTVDTEARPDASLERIIGVFGRLLHAALAGGHPRDSIEAMAGDQSDTPIGAIKRATAMRHRDWLSDNERRMQLRAKWAKFFEHFDVMLMPVQPRAAIPHDHREPQFERTVDIGGIERPYGDLMGWLGPAGAAYLPSTVVPVAKTADGLPIGVQIVGPFLHDRTTLQFARVLEALGFGCPRPPGS